MKIVNNILIFFLIQSILTEDLTAIFNVQLGNLAIFLSIIYILINYKNLKITKIMFLLIIVIFTTSTLALLFSFSASFIDVLRVFKINSVILFVLIGNILKNQDDRSLIKTGVFSFILFICILYAQNFKSLLILDSSTRLFKMEYLFFSIETVNLFHAMIAFNLCLFIVINRHYNFFSQVIEIIVLFLVLILILLSLVRTAYFIVVIVLIIYYIFERYLEKKYISFAIGIILSLFGLLIFKESSYFDRVMYTFSGSATSKLDNSSFYRIQLFKNVVNEMTKSVKLSFLGYGFKDFSSLNINSLGLESTHNGFLNLFVKGGTLYLSSFLLFGIYLIKKHLLGLNTLVIVTIFTLINLTGDGIAYVPLQQMFFLYLGFINGGNNDK